MNREVGQVWALVLAAGEGRRLHPLTAMPSGLIVPKQFCSLRSGPSLLQEALERTQAVAPSSRVCVVVAREQRRWWEPLLSGLPSANVIVQPDNRGTANGLLLPLLHILRHDPAAQIIVLPSDQHVRREAVLAKALQDAVRWLKRRDRQAVLLLGIEPERPDCELGYVVPGAGASDGMLRVEQFVEKPAAAAARALMERGALWNAFILAASGEELIALYRQRVPQVLAEMQAAIEQDLSAGPGSRATEQLYARLATLDFSRDILHGEESNLRLLPVPRCGWNDLGTPEHVGEALRADAALGPAPAHAGHGTLSLAEQYARWRRTRHDRAGAS